MTDIADDPELGRTTLRKALSAVPTPVTVVSASDSEGPYGLAAGFGGGIGWRGGGNGRRGCGGRPRGGRALGKGRPRGGSSARGGSSGSRRPWLICTGDH